MTATDGGNAETAGACLGPVVLTIAASHIHVLSRHMTATDGGNAETAGACLGPVVLTIKKGAEAPK